MNVVVTGANRGLGLEFVRQCLGRGDRVFACCRRPDGANELQELGGERLTIVPLDVAEASSVAELPTHVDGRVDLLVNNAGIYGTNRNDSQTVSDTSAEIFERVYRVNVVGPLQVTQALADRFSADSTVLNVSSGYGSIENASSGWPAAYCCSKAALNMLSRIAAAELPCKVVTMSPGWVRTDMGGPNANLSPEQSVSGMLRVANDLSGQQNGSFLQYDGAGLPW